MSGENESFHQSHDRLKTAKRPVLLKPNDQGDARIIICLQWGHGIEISKLSGPPRSIRADLKGRGNTLVNGNL